MPSLDGVKDTPQLTDLQFGYDDLIPIYDMSERKTKAVSFRELLKAYGYYGTAVIDALREHKANNAAAGEPPINDQYFTQTDGTDISSTLSYNADCWAARFDLTGTAWHAPSDNESGSRRAHLIGPRAVVFADHYEPEGDITFTNLQGQRFTYSFASGTVSSGGTTYQPTYSLGNDGKVGVLSTDVDSSLRVYEIATSVESGEYVLATRSRESSSSANIRQRVHFHQTYAAYDGSSSLIALQLSSGAASSAASSPFYAYMDDPSTNDSSDGVFTVDDNNIPKLLTTNYSILGTGLVTGPMYGKTSRLADIDTFLSAWGTTRG